MADGIGEAIGTFLKFFTGKDGWRFWFAASIVFWLIWYKEPYKLVLYPAIFCSIIILLIFISWCKEKWNKHEVNKQEREKRAQLQRLKDSEQERDILTYKNFIWKHFVTADIEIIDDAVSLLDFEILERNEFSRYIVRDKLNDKNFWDKYCRTVNYFNISSNHICNSVELIQPENLPNGVLIHFDEYLYNLLCHYKTTGRREFL